MRKRSAAAVVSIVVAVAAVIAVVLISGGRNRTLTAACPASRWIESWYAAPSDASSLTDARLVTFAAGSNQTLRVVVTPHYGGSEIRLRFDNTFSATPITLSQVAVARDAGAANATSAATVTGTSRPVTFGGGQGSVTVPAGGQAVSDPIAFSFDAFENLAVSIYVGGGDEPMDEHFTGRQVSYGTPPGGGNHVDDTAGAAFTQTTTARFLLSGVDVRAAGRAGTVVAFGDSLTDGYQGPPATFPENRSTLNLNARYPDWLARRILAARLALSVANAGISGNLVTMGGNPVSGPSALSRFTRDAVEVPGASTVILMEGTNDITAKVTAPAIEAGLAKLIAMAHAAKLRVLLGTIPPRGATGAAEATRRALNTWITGQHDADGVIDFAAAVADPSDPSRLRAQDNGGDGGHLTPAGYEAMADAVPLGHLSGPNCTPPRP